MTNYFSHVKILLLNLHFLVVRSLKVNNEPLYMKPINGLSRFFVSHLNEKSSLSFSTFLYSH